MCTRTQKNLIISLRNNQRVIDEDDTIRNALDDEDIAIAIKLVEENINIESLTRQRRGYIARHYPKWSKYNLRAELENTDTESVRAGTGVEITSVNDDRLRGELLHVLLNTLRGKLFTGALLADNVRDVLQQTSTTGKTFIIELQSGALGVGMYRKTRFLHILDDDGVINWVRFIISDWYPARIAKDGDTYALCHANNLQIRLESFKRWMLNHPNTPDNTLFEMDICETTELPDKDAELKSIARFRRNAGDKIKDIAEDIGMRHETVGRWCKDIKPLQPVQFDVLSILNDGEVWKVGDIVKHSRFSDRKAKGALKSLLSINKIRKVKHGFYQRE
ncbi:MAG: hypothetical protein F4090_01500 [Nitrospira sp. SB0672_bin_25]|nr:hypothetical protein [Nitrospira sp. SB0672_bin_25]